MLRILHLNPDFKACEREPRTASIIKALGDKAQHTVLAPRFGEAWEALLAGEPVNFVDSSKFPRLDGHPWPTRLQNLAAAMKPFDLVLTYDWGAINAALAHSVFRDRYALPPLVHHEFTLDEAERGKRNWLRNWRRRIAMTRCEALVVKSHSLDAVAQSDWHAPRGKVHLIPDGIDTAAYAVPPKRDALPRIVKRDGEKWLGFNSGTGDQMVPLALVKLLPALSEGWQLVILGDAPRRDAIRKEAARLEIAHRVHFPGKLVEPAKAIGLFDMFVPSPDNEGEPSLLVEAMAAGTVIVTPAFGDVRALVSPQNRPFIVPADDTAGLDEAVLQLANDDELRRRIGSANRELAKDAYDRKKSVDAQLDLYGQVMALRSFP